MSELLATFCSSNSDELIINCEALIREIECKENQIISLLNTLFLLQNQEISAKPVLESEDSRNLSLILPNSSEIQPAQSLENLDFLAESAENLDNPRDFSTKLQNIFIKLQYSFAQFARIVHYVNIANSPQPLKGWNSRFAEEIRGVSSGDCENREDFEEEEEEKLMSALLYRESQRKKLTKVLIPLTFLARNCEIRSILDERNLISQAKKKKSLEVFFKWKLRKWDKAKSPHEAKLAIYAIPCRICLNKIWSNKLAAHSKYCLQKSQIRHELESQRKALGKFVDNAVENKRNIEIQLMIEK